jgi:hypothetical protein
MISWKAREASACEAHAARRYNLSSLRPQDQATYQSCAMLGLPRGHTVSGALDHKPHKAVLHSGRLEEAPFMAGPGPRTHRRPENSRSERGTPPPGASQSHAKKAERALVTVRRSTDRHAATPTTSPEQPLLQ